MRKTVRVIAIILVAVMLSGLMAGCESEAKPGVTSEQPPAGNTNSPASSSPTGSSGGDSGGGGNANQANDAPAANSGDDGPAAGGVPVAAKGKDIYNDPIKISVISISTAGQVNRVYQLALNEQAVRFPNVTLDYKDAEYNPNKQITLIEEAITQGYDAIFLECMDPVAVIDAIEKAEQAGIPVITTNAAQPFCVNSLHIAGADYSSGWKGGQELDKLTKGIANRTAIVLDCPAAFKPGARMGTGFEDYIDTTDIKKLEAIGIENWSADNAQIAMSNMLTKYRSGEITMVYCASGDIALGAMNAIEQAGRGGDGIYIWGFMGYPNELEAIKSGKMAGTMFSDTYAQYSALFYYGMYFIATGLTSVTAGFSATPVVEQPMIPVTNANVDQIMAVSRWYYDPAVNPGGGGSGGGEGISSVVSGLSALPGGKDIYNDPIRISVISISTAGQVNRVYQLALNEQAVRFPNVTLDYKDAEYNPNKQITLIEEAITQGYDAIFLECMDPVAVIDAIEKAEQAGIPVITTNAAQPFCVNSLHIAGADYSSGWKGGQELDALTKGMPNRTAIVLDCPAAFKPGARMGTGFEDYIETTDIKKLEAIGIENWSADNAQIAMSNMLTKYRSGEITMVYCASGDIALGAMNAIEQAGRGGDGIYIWGFMGYPNELDAIKSGKMAGTMFSDTYIQYSSLFYYGMFFIATGLTAARAGFDATPIVEQPMIPVTKANVDQIMAVSRWYYDPALNPQ